MKIGTPYNKGKSYECTEEAITNKIMEEHKNV